MGSKKPWNEVGYNNNHALIAAERPLRPSGPVYYALQTFPN